MQLYHFSVGTLNYLLQASPPKNRLLPVASVDSAFPEARQSFLSRTEEILSSLGLDGILSVS